MSLEHAKSNALFGNLSDADQQSDDEENMRDINDDHQPQVTFFQNLRPPTNGKHGQLGYSWLKLNNEYTSDLCRSERKYDLDDDVEHLHDRRQQERPEQRNFHGLWTSFQEDEHDFSDVDRSKEELIQLVHKYADVCIMRIRELEERHQESLSDEDRANLEWLKDERNTWWLLESLLSLEKKRSFDQRKAEEDSKTFVPSPRDQMNPNPSGLRYGEDYLAERDLTVCQGTVPDQYRKCKAVVDWYETCVQEEMNMRNLKIEEVKEQRKCGLRGRRLPHTEDSPNFIDPDQTPFVDRYSSTRMLQVWNALRAGRCDVAEELCRENGEVWRAESLNGGIPSRLTSADENDGGGEWLGNPQRFLWKSVTMAMGAASGDGAVAGGGSGSGSGSGSGRRGGSTTNNVDALKYERAVYSKLTGHYQQLMKTNVCQSWEDRCWSAYSCMCERLLDNHILERRSSNLRGTERYHRGGIEYLTGPPSLKRSEHVRNETDDVQKMLDDPNNYIQSVFDTIASMTGSWDAGVKNADSQLAQWHHRNMQASLVIGHVRELFVRINLLPSTSSSATSSTPPAAELNRFVCHLATCYQFMSRFSQQVATSGPTRDEYDHLIGTYIQYLTQRQQYSLIATYSMTLSKEMKINTYARM